MNYQEAKETCHVRSAIYRESQYGNKSTPAIMYGKNHSISLDERVPKEDQLANDWLEWDPNDFYDCSLGADSY